MKVEIITIGDEVLSGNVVNTNMAFLSDRLWLLGLDVSYQTGVRDDPEAIIEVLKLAATRASIVVVTGGLGPTKDDLTLEAAAKAFGKKIVLNAEVKKYLEMMFRQWGRTLSENNLKQAHIPDGAKPYLNRVGTAPGVKMTYKKVDFYFLPGVPKEMKHLFDDYVAVDLKKSEKSKFKFQSRILKTFGAAESELDSAIKDLYVHGLDIDDVRIGFRAHFPETTIKLSAWAKTDKEATALIEKAAQKIRSRVDKFIYGEGEETLESCVGALLAKKKKTLALAESCTGGLLAHRITSIPGSSDYFLGGVVSYANDVKEKVLGVSGPVIKKQGAVSPQCAIEMAEGARKLMKSDYAIAVTGIAGPGGGTAQKPVGTLHIAIATAAGTEEKKFFFPRNREWFKVLAASLALDMLRKKLV